MFDFSRSPGREAEPPFTRETPLGLFEVWVGRWIWTRRQDRMIRVMGGRRICRKCAHGAQRTAAGEYLNGAAPQCRRPLCAWGRGIWACRCAAYTPRPPLDTSFLPADAAWAAWDIAAARHGHLRHTNVRRLAQLQEADLGEASRSRLRRFLPGLAGGGPGDRIALGAFKWKTYSPAGRRQELLSLTYDVYR